MQAIPSDDDVVQSIAETAQQLGTTKTTLWRWRNEPDHHGLPFVRLSSAQVGYRRADVRAFLAARRVGKLPSERPEAASPIPNGKRIRGAIPEQAA
jgi:hypothetical protein